MGNPIEKLKTKLNIRKKFIIFVVFICVNLFLGELVVLMFTQITIILIFNAVVVVFLLIIVKMLSYIKYIGNWEELPNGYIASMENKEKGTIHNPLIINNTEILPKNLLIEKSDYFIEFQDCEILSLKLVSCQNISLKNCNIDFFSIFLSQKITLENCRIKTINVINCSDINCTRSTIEKVLRLSKCKENKIIDCSIKNLKLIQTQENTIRFCSINKIKIKYSKNNIFEGNSILGKKKV